jgi:hypothetical protein
MTYKLSSIVPVWLIALVGAVLVGVLAVSDERLTWLALVFAACVLATFGIQLALATSAGFVLRAMTSIGGAFLILVAATAVALLTA